MKKSLFLLLFFLWFMNWADATVYTITKMNLESIREPAPHKAALQHPLKKRRPHGNRKEIPGKG